MQAQLIVNIPDDETMVAMVTVRRRPDGSLVAQLHGAPDTRMDDPEVMGRVVNTIRWLADAQEINLLPTAEVDHGRA